MQPPLVTGTILQKRYRLLSILGQGGFGRTYLAEDQGRFNEPCALKELIPAQEDAYVLEKSRELFGREAATLYQIQHPQIPQFRATFEEDGRLFLVQDYVEGKNYRELLNQRKPAGASFAEAEVLSFLRQMLPVLAHIHSKGIIHRDISPDNIILREGDRLPVLIDFGVVKELATRLQLSTTATPVTTVGKPGYAPSEQIQTGRAYPNSDLYALAVTAIVLLTGKEPQELFDDIQLNWQWRRWSSVDDRLAAVLDRMLSYRPGDRFQSAGEVLQALDFVSNPIPNAQPPIPPPQPPIPPPQPAIPRTQARTQNVSQMHTIAVGRRPEPIHRSRSRPHQADPVIPRPSSRSIWDDPWAVFAIGIVLAILAGFTSWTVVSALFNSRQQPVNFPTPMASPTPIEPTPTPDETPTPTPTPSLEPFSQRLDLASGQLISKQGNLPANATVNYIIRGQQGQQLNTYLTGEGVLMTVLAPDQSPVDVGAQRALGWKGTLPYTGDYTIQLSPIKGLAQSDYKLNISLSDPVLPSPTPTPTPTPSDSPSPTDTQVNIQQIDFPPGEQAVSISARTTPQNIKRYLVNVQQGQVLRANVQKGAVTLDIRDPNGQLVENASGILSWEAPVSGDGNYQIDAIATKETSFTLDISVRNP
ncbi:MAG TPA: serine/threonine-protein kinase [Candidatus Obscuribacterales bacterium]